MTNSMLTGEPRRSRNLRWIVQIAMFKVDR
jgi:hypothetical protein